MQRRARCTWVQRTTRHSQSPLSASATVSSRRRRCLHGLLQRRVHGSHSIGSAPHAPCRMTPQRRTAVSVRAYAAYHTATVWSELRRCGVRLWCVKRHPPGRLRAWCAPLRTKATAVPVQCVPALFLWNKAVVVLQEGFAGVEHCNRRCCA